MKPFRHICTFFILFLAYAKGQSQSLSLSTQSVIHEKCLNDSTGQVILNVANGVSPYTYIQGNDTQNNNSFSNLSLGNYIFQVIDGNGNWDSIHVKINPGTRASFTIKNTSSTCDYSQDGVLTIDTILSNHGKQKIAWYSGLNKLSSNEKIENLITGDYRFELTDTLGCISDTTVHLGYSDSIVVSAQSQNVSCFGFDDGSINLQIKTNYSQLDYEWIGPDSFSRFLKDINNLSAGSYTGKIVDINKTCSTEIKVEILQPDSLLLKTTINNQVSCYSGNDGSLTVLVNGGSTPYSYQWSVGGSIITSKNIANGRAGTYHLEVTDNNNCQAYDTMEVTEPAELQLSSVKVNNKCSDGRIGKISLTPSGGVGGYEFTWLDGDNKQNRDSLYNRTYTVFLKDSNACFINESFQITSPSALNLSVSSKDLNCNQSSDGEINLYPSGGTYPWSTLIKGPGGFSSNATTVKKLKSGSYFISLVDFNGCIVFDTLLLKEPDKLNSQINVVNPNCNEELGSISVKVSGGLTPYGYSWLDQTGKVKSFSSAMFDLDDGQYSVTIRDANQCLLFDTGIIKSPPLLKLAVKNIVNNDCIEDSSGKIEVLANGGITPYTYRLNSTNFSSTSIFTNLVNSRYLVSVKDKNGCQDSLNVNINAVDSIPPNIRLRTSPYVFLDAGGGYTLKVTDVDSGTFDNCKLLELSMSQSQFDCSNIGTTRLAIEARDSMGNVSKDSLLITIADTIRPTVRTRNYITYLDKNGTSPLIVSNFNDGSFDNCSVSSMRLNIDTVTCSDLGRKQLRVTALDKSGNSASQLTEVYTRDSIKPSVRYKNINIYLNPAGTAKIDSSMIDDGSFDNCRIQKKHLSKAIFDCNNIGSNVINYTVTDISGNATMQTVRINVIDTVAPRIKAKPISVYLNNFGFAEIKVSDIENGSTDNCRISSRFLNKYVFTCDDVGSNLITYDVTDASGNKSTSYVTVSVYDTIRPKSILRSQTVFLDKNGYSQIDASFVNNGIDDNCSIKSINLSKDQFYCSDLGENIIQVTIIDNNGNKTLDSTKIYVRDTVQPKIRIRNRIAYLDENGGCLIPPDYFDDGSSDNCSIVSQVLSKYSFGCNDLGLNTLIYSIRDTSNNTNIQAVELTLKDTSKPVVFVENLKIYLDPQGFAKISVKDFMSKSSDNCRIDEFYFSDSIFTCDNIGLNVIDCYASDNTGNLTIKSFRVNVYDTLEPVFTTQPKTIYIDTSGFAQLEWQEVVVSIFENCSDYSVSIEPVLFTSNDIGENFVTLSFTDASGNKSVEKTEKVFVLPGDTDRDSIPDFVERAEDFDLDGIPNYRDKDSDNDGITDLDENLGVAQLLDFDGDGRYNIYDIDSDEDGINDIDEVNGYDPDKNGIVGLGTVITDGWGIPVLANTAQGYKIIDTDNDNQSDFLDLDSDEDQIYDIVENQNSKEFIDTDDDGVPNFRDLDSDADFISDNIEGVSDFDGDGISNFIDRDSDGDGILDSLETTDDIDLDGAGNWLDLDSDGDNILDVDEGAGDFDLDGIGNWKDDDSDNDGILDLIEGVADIDSDGVSNALDLDSDGDEIPDRIEAIPFFDSLPADTDSDGIPDFIDQDSDNDELLDFIEGFPNIPDTDDDGIPNYRDIDSDDDGILDKDESQGDRDGDGLIDAVDKDADGDGIPDFIETALDSDGDGVPNYLDLDSDNDGFNDIWEAGGDDTSGRGITTILTLIPPDTDNDGVLDPYDLDADGDGILDIIESFYNYIDDNNDGRQDGPDTDGDGIVDFFDGYNGVYGDYYDYPPWDFDYDGKPDFQDKDSDDDGIPDIVEGPEDFDFDFYPNYIDEDSDSDQILDKDESSDDIDDDGFGNYIDLDSDGDNILDEIETDADFDKDGVPNYKDIDSDNDELLDLEEGLIDKDGNNLQDYLDPHTFIAEILTPNGDGVNDTLRIRGMQNFPDSRLTIFNQFGQVVFESGGPYQNDWTGKPNKNGNVNIVLPEGIYYYIVYHQNKSNPELKREPNKGNFYLKP